MKRPSSTVILTPEGDDVPSEEVLHCETHSLNAQVEENRDINLSFSSRVAMYEFAKALLHEAVFGVGGQIEFYPLIVEGSSLVVNGTRLVEGSSRIFVSYGDRE